MPIRSMVETDLAAVAALEQCSPSAWTAEQLAAGLRQSQQWQYVYCPIDQQQITGWLCVLIAGDEAELLKLAVFPGMRRQGMATSMLEELFCQLRRQGIVHLFLEVREQNMPARQLYQRCGFIQVGRRRGYYADPPDDALLLKKKLLLTALPDA